MYIGIVFIMMIAGGTGTLVGPVVGAVVFSVLPEVLRVAETARNLLRPTAGDVRYGGALVSGLAPAAIARRGIARTFQITSLFPDLTVADNIRIATHLWAQRDLPGALLRSRAFSAREAEIDRTLDELLELVRLTKFRQVPARALPYGAQRGLELAVALATRCRLLLLDEPAAGLNAEETDRVREVIQTLRMGLCDRLVVLNYGETIAEGPPQQIATDPRVIEAYLGAERGF